MLFMLPILAGAIGFYPLFKVLQYKTRREIKMRIKQGVPEEELHMITFAPGEQIDWVREGKEFRYKDNMYDIVRTGNSKDTVIYYCVNDTEEKVLFSTLDELVKKDMNEKSGATNNPSKHLLKLLLNLYHETSSSVVISPRMITINFHYLFYWTAPGLELSTPPPESC